MSFEPSASFPENLSTPAELIASIGGDHLIELEAGDGAAITDLTALERIDGVRDASAQNGTVRIHAGDLHRVLPLLLDELGRQSILLSELRTRSATLEDVFVSLTGRHLRDE